MISKRRNESNSFNIAQYPHMTTLEGQQYEWFYIDSGNKQYNTVFNIIFMGVILLWIITFIMFTC